MLIPFVAAAMILLIVIGIYLLVRRVEGKRDLRQDIIRKKRQEGEI